MGQGSVGRKMGGEPLLSLAMFSPPPPPQAALVRR